MAGPFDQNPDAWASPRGTKLWVALIDRRTSEAATVEAIRPGDPTVQFASKRQPASHEKLPTFYPGPFRVPTAGTWQINVTIGPAIECFLIHATRS
jgi:hypothetical protein